VILISACLVWICVCANGAVPSDWPVIYVDDDGADVLGIGAELGSEGNPYTAIQAAVDAAVSGQTIIVAPGIYTQADPDIDLIDFQGKDIVLQSKDPNDPLITEQTILEGSIRFSGSETPAAALSGFNIKLFSESAIWGEYTRATLSYCMIVGNITCDGTVMFSFDGLIQNCLIADNRSNGQCREFYPVIYGCHGVLRNCTIANNASGINVASEDGIIVGPLKIENCILFGNQGYQIVIPEGEEADISYSCIFGGWESVYSEGILNRGPGNLNSDPQFVGNGVWQGDHYVAGDYHLKSGGWRWNPVALHGSHWMYDNATSVCIDAGNPEYDIANEPTSVDIDPENDHGINQQLNMGAYGGTNQASLLPVDFEIPSQVIMPWDGYQPLP